MIVEGGIISGEYDAAGNQFSLEKVKNFYTQSVLNHHQLNSIYHYLKKHEHEDDGQIITLYDQMPVRLAKEEISQLIRDLEKLMELYQ